MFYKAEQCAFLFYDFLIQFGETNGKVVWLNVRCTRFSCWQSTGSKFSQSFFRKMARKKKICIHYLSSLQTPKKLQKISSWEKMKTEWGHRTRYIADIQLNLFLIFCGVGWQGIHSPCTMTVYCNTTFVHKIMLTIPIAMCLSVALLYIKITFPPVQCTYIITFFWNFLFAASWEIIH